MSSIKTRNVVKGTIKTLDKSIVGMQKTKDNIVNIKEKSENSTNSKENNVNEYATNKIQKMSKNILNNFIKVKHKIKNVNIKLTEKNKIRKNKKGIKISNKIAKAKAEKTAQEAIKASKKALEKARESVKRNYYSAKFIYKTISSAFKSVKTVVNFLILGGGIAFTSIIISCLVGLLCGSVFGIFFSGEKSSPNSMTIRDVIDECNQDFSDKIQSIQKSYPHDDYVLEGNTATWRDILTVYTIKVSNGNNEQEVVTVDEKKRKILKDIYWDMNIITSEVKDEIVINHDNNTEEQSKEEHKKVLHIKITSKSAEEMKNEYHFNSNQIKQYNELSSNEYTSLWNNVIFGMDFGDYILWRQNDVAWSNIKIGNTNNTIGEIGCLVTSIAILIEKSGVNTTINNFNPGIFVEELNKKGGFDSNGNLQYSKINEVVPNFKYVGNVNLRNKTKSEKLAIITQYFNKGYYLTVEVKGATSGNQHWVAVIGINANSIVMVDPATNYTDMWSIYEFSNISQFNYFKIQL